MASTANVLRAQKAAKFIEENLAGLIDPRFCKVSDNPGTKANPGLQVRVAFSFENSILKALKKTFENEGIKYVQLFHEHAPFLKIEPTEFDKILGLKNLKKKVADNLKVIEKADQLQPQQKEIDVPSGYEFWWFINDAGLIPKDKWDEHDAMLPTLPEAINAVIKRNAALIKSPDLHCPGFNELQLAMAIKNAQNNLKQAIQEYNNPNHEIGGRYETAVRIRKAVSFFRDLQKFHSAIENKASPEVQQQAYAFFLSPAARGALQQQIKPAAKSPAVQAVSSGMPKTTVHAEKPTPQKPAITPKPAIVPKPAEKGAVGLAKQSKKEEPKQSRAAALGAAQKNVWQKPAAVSQKPKPGVGEQNPGTNVEPRVEDAQVHNAMQVTSEKLEAMRREAEAIKQQQQNQQKKPLAKPPAKAMDKPGKNASPTAQQKAPVKAAIPTAEDEDLKIASEVKQSGELRQRVAAAVQASPKGDKVEQAKPADSPDPRARVEIPEELRRRWKQAQVMAAAKDTDKPGFLAQKNVGQKPAAASEKPKPGVGEQNPATNVEPRVEPFAPLQRAKVEEMIKQLKLQQAKTTPVAPQSPKPKGMK